jgi:hypothetical protein
MPCYQHFSHPAQPIGPATLSRWVSLHMQGPAYPVTYHAVMSPILIVGINRVYYLLVRQVTSEVTLAGFGAIYPIIRIEP